MTAEKKQEQSGGGGLGLPPTHPVSVFMKEHELAEQALERLEKLAEEIISNPKPVEEAIRRRTELERFLGVLMDMEGHNAREENTLFPLLEKKGLVGPTQVMWAEHKEMKELKEELLQFTRQVGPSTGHADVVFAGRRVRRYAETIRMHNRKENSVLYPTALQMLDEAEWELIKRECDAMGYCSFTPPEMTARPAAQAPAPAGASGIATLAPGVGGIGAPAALAGDGLLTLPTGTLTLSQCLGLLDTLPVEISFVDHEDIVRYFNETKERIFPRTTAVLGRTVQNCHPAQSVHLVNKILAAFRSGDKDSASFWIDLQGKKVLIQYFAVRDRQGSYLGCLEGVQSLTELQKLTGERRLLDW